MHTKYDRQPSAYLFPKKNVFQQSKIKVALKIAPIPLQNNMTYLIFYIFT